MTRPQLVISATAAIAVLWLALSVVATRHAPALNARIVEVANVGDQHFKVDALVTNRTGYRYGLFTRLQIWNGAGWQDWADLPAAYSQNDTVTPHGAEATFCAFKHFKPGSRLRCVVEGERVRSGMDRFLFSLQQRLFDGDRNLPPNQTTMHVDVAATTEEFKEP